jgi:hypothetical protein
MSNPKNYDRIFPRKSDSKYITLSNVKYLPSMLEGALKKKIEMYGYSADDDYDLNDMEGVELYENGIRVLELLLEKSQPIDKGERQRLEYYRTTKDNATNWSVEIRFHQSLLKEVEEVVKVVKRNIFFKILEKLQPNPVELIYKFNNKDVFKYKLTKSSDTETLWDNAEIIIFGTLPDHISEYSSVDYGNTKPADPRAHYGGNRRSTKNRINKSKNKKTKRSNKKH